VTYFEATTCTTIAEARQASIIAVIAFAACTAASAIEFKVNKRFFSPVRALYSVNVVIDELAPDDLHFFLCCYRHALVSAMI
jgi:hypothetical protein